MRIRGPSLVAGAVALVLALTAPATRAQDDSVSALLERIRELETRAAARDARIEELESRLAERDRIERPSELETMIDALVSEGYEDQGSVRAKRSLKLAVGGQLRLRGEYRSVKNYGAGVEDDLDFVIQRTRLHFDFRVLDHVRIFVQLQDSRNWGEEASVVGDLEGVDIHQAYVDYENVFDRPWTFRVGRQELSFGDQRLVSPLDWHPVGRAWDGVRTWYEAEQFTLDLFATNIKEGSPPADGTADDDHVFAGIYFHFTGIENHEIDVYLFYRTFADGTFTAESGAMGDLEDGTVGIRFAGKFDGLSYRAEGVFQFGDRAGDDVRAYAWVLKVDYTFDGDMKPSIGLEWDFASGDDDPTDGDFETFDPLFPFGHAYQGYLDLFAWRNGHDLVARASFKPTSEAWVEAAVHGFILDSDTDAWYNAAGLPIRRVGGGVGNFVGIELDLHCKYALDDATALWFGYSHFFTGDYVEDTGDDSETDWVWFQMTISF